MALQRSDPDRIDRINSRLPATKGALSASPIGMWLGLGALRLSIEKEKTCGRYVSKKYWIDPYTILLGGHPVSYTNNGPILGVDLDGVCADFYKRMREIAAEWLERDLESLPQDVSYGLPEWGIVGIEHYEKLHRFAVTQRGLFETSEMIPGARKYLRILSDEGYKIRIITHRLFIPFFHQIAIQQTVKWLDFNGIPYWDICFLKEKEQVNADIYIDDSPSNIINLRNEGLFAICFANSTNKSCLEPRANSWKDVYDIISKRAVK